MASKVVRVSEEALAVASQYSPDISTAILLMQATLDERNKHILDLKALDKVIRNAVAESLSDLGRGY